MNKGVYIYRCIEKTNSDDYILNNLGEGEVEILLKN